MVLLPPFSGFTLGAGMNLFNIAAAGASGIVLGLLTLVSTGLLSFIIYSLLRRQPDPMGAAIGTTAGVAATTPAAIAAADPTFEPQVETATAQIAASVVITAILCPLMAPSWPSGATSGLRSGAKSAAPMCPARTSWLSKSRRPTLSGAIPKC